MPPQVNLYTCTAIPCLEVVAPGCRSKARRRGSAAGKHVETLGAVAMSPGSSMLPGSCPQEPTA